MNFYTVLMIIIALLAFAIIVDLKGSKGCLRVIERENGWFEVQTWTLFTGWTRFGFSGAFYKTKERAMDAMKFFNRENSDIKNIF